MAKKKTEVEAEEVAAPEEAEAKPVKAVEAKACPTCGTSTTSAVCEVDGTSLNN